MAVLRTTPEFLTWLAARGYSLTDLDSPPVAWMLVGLFKWERDANLETEA